MRTFLASLLLWSMQTVTLDRLSRSVWPEAPLSAAANLRTYAYTLRMRLDRALPGLGARWRRYGAATGCRSRAGGSTCTTSIR
ncbi:hypothetical protein [Nonomuraea sp. B19D2]|uniref:hypothetical protein n=1 Tax=Nonomuraea sp. B19D2 TaxID=3159561 RepID=UPI0032DAA8BB